MGLRSRNILGMRVVGCLIRASTFATMSFQSWHRARETSFSLVSAGWKAKGLNRKLMGARKDVYFGHWSCYRNSPLPKNCQSSSLHKVSDSTTDPKELGNSQGVICDTSARGLLHLYVALLHVTRR